MNQHVYVLELKGGKYYVGISDDPERRFLYHVSGKGAAWTRMHQPIRILEIRSGSSRFDEDKVTKEYMATYGIDNVRGGSYVHPTLRLEDRMALKREIWMAQNVCMRCGHSSHYVTDCFARTDVCGDPIEDAGDVARTRDRQDSPDRRHQGPSPARRHLRDSPAQNETTKKERWIAQGGCFRCGATSHFVQDCYARTDVDGDPIGNTGGEAVRSLQERNGAMRFPPQFSPDFNQQGPSPAHYRSPGYGGNAAAPERCRRCQRTNHTTENCYASTDTKGRYLP